MKKLILVFITIVFFISTLSISSYATDKVIFDDKVEINEWDTYNYIISKSDEELLKLGLDLDEIKEIRNFSFEDEIRRRADLTDEELYAYGYSDKKITNLRSIATKKHISEANLRDISENSLTTALRYIDNGLYIASPTVSLYYVDFQYEWEWENSTLMTFTDRIAISFNSLGGSQYNHTFVGGYKLVYYLRDLSTYEETIATADWKTFESNVLSFYADFPVGVRDFTHDLKYFAYRGYGKFRLQNDSPQMRFYLMAAYGHSIIMLTPDYSFGINEDDGLPTINFSWYLDEQHCGGIVEKDFTVIPGNIYFGYLWGKNGTGGKKPG